MKYGFIKQLGSSMQAVSFVGFVFALLASVGFVFLTFGVDFVQGTAPYWLTQVDDVTQYISGFNIYFNAPWGIPLLAFDGLNYPQGTRVTFVDAIPLYALILKLLAPSSWAPFNPFGVWVAFCFILQGVGAWWILKELKINSWVALCSLLALFLTYPALMTRLGHISLMSQWIILFALALYLKGRNSDRLIVWGWSSLLLCAFYINIYLTAMAVGIMLVSTLSLRKTKILQGIYACMVPFLIIGATLFLTILPLPAGEVAREFGFGHYSMNVLSPIMGGDLMSIKAGQGAGQYEGFNYLGLGVLATLSYIYLFKRDVFRVLRNEHKALIGLLIFFTIYALSDHIYFGGQEIVVYKYPKLLDAITSQLRVSGRFFWPVGYCLMVLTVVVLYRTLERKYFILAMFLLVCIQLIDLKTIYNSKRNVVNRQSPQPLDSKLWANHLLPDVKTLYFYPKFKCGTNPMETLLPLMQFTANQGMKLNTGYIARYVPDCNDTMREIAQSDQKRSAYIFSLVDYPDEEKVKLFFSDPNSVRCEIVQFAYVCQPLIE